MKIAILSCFYPFRGGIAQFNASMLLELGKTHTVRAFNFKRQYPGILFPGKTQYVTEDDDAVSIESTPLLDTVNPFSYVKTLKEIRRWKPDLVLMSYWMSWFAPSLGFIARRLRKECKVVSVLHNVIPHEPRFFDAPLTKYFLSGCDGNVCLCDEVARDLRKLKPGADSITLFHPIYGHFGDRIPKEEACRALGTDAGRKTLLFFGLIREYKGLDILLRAFSQLDDSYRLVIAGEPYGSFDKYQEIIDSSGCADRIHLFTHYIKDSEVKTYFSAADLVVLPYRTATQSGINAIACHFGIPMVVTDTGGLKQTVGDTGIGLVAAKAEPDCIREEIVRYFGDGELRERCKSALATEKERLSWKAFARQLSEYSIKL
ncbi:MAG: glycosyltransferase [Candidatus Cryptobacteroides sp.]